MKILHCSVLILLVTLQACTIARFRLRNDAQGENQSVNTLTPPCSLRYTIDVQYEMRLTHTQPDLGGQAPQTITDRYVAATEDVFKGMSCVFEQVDKNGQPSLHIQVLVSPMLSALPQEWLTGLSLGLIPSWGTRYGEFVYKFVNKNTDESVTRYVDLKSFNHLTLFPVFWMSFVGQDEIALYKKALIDFIGATP